MNKTESEVVWLTGSASGIGKHLTNIFIQKGYRVIASDINVDGMNQASREANWPTEVMIRSLDVCDEGSWKTVFDDIISAYGKIDILMNIAGYVRPGFMLETPSAELAKHININLFGMIYGSQLVARQMVEQGRGHIINVASMAGVGPVPGLGFYATSKFGIRGYTLILAQELKEKGVHVTVVCPDLIKTPQYDLQLDYEKESALVFSGRAPLTVEDVEKAIFNKVLTKKPMEYLINPGRGWLVKLSSVFPELSWRFGLSLRKKGEERIRKAREARDIQ